jgi:ArsR family transcriptional regulator
VTGAHLRAAAISSNVLDKAMLSMVGSVPMSREAYPDPSLIVQQLQALGDESRLKIVALLAKGERCVCDFMGPMGLGHSVLSFHLRKLRDAGLAIDRPQGRQVFYSLNHGAIAQLESFVGALPSLNFPDPVPRLRGRWGPATKRRPDPRLSGRRNDSRKKP